MIVANPQPGLTKSEFEQVLHSALNGLYNPAILHSSLLIGWLGLSQSENPEYLLRKVLLDSIEALYPNYEIPSGSKTWRVYQILRRRFIEQILQRKVAGELGISLRQLQREEKIAREILGDYVWKTYQLEESKPSELNSANSSTAPSQASLPDSGDLQWLRENLPVLDVNLSDLIQDGLHTLIGICDSSGIQVEYHCQEPNPVLFLQPSLFRQGLLNLLITIIQFVPGGKIRIQAYNQTEKIVIDIEAIPSIDHRGQNSRGITEGLNTAGLFFNCCNGSIEIEDPTDTTPLRVRIALPILERMAVLVVEDHADTLHLFQRYLADSRYIFWGASSVNEGLALAEAILPRVIVLDVMMPESDGWEFLGRLHVHPKLMHIPVIVYSIVSQENLALSLGAAEFLQKPISRKELLAALDRQVTRSSRESG